MSQKSLRKWCRHFLQNGQLLFDKKAQYFVYFIIPLYTTRFDSNFQIWFETHKILSFLTKKKKNNNNNNNNEVFKTHFWQSVDVILQDISVAKTIV